MAKSKTTLEKGRAKGRPKGSINKITLAFRESLELKGFDLVERLVDLYENGNFDEKEKTRIIFRMMEYSFPKLKEREVTQDGEVVETQQPVNITLGDLIKVARDEA
jgi:hypothetical protein